MGQSLTVKSENAPAAVGPYCQARWAGDLLLLSGQLGLDPASGEMVEGGVAEQARQVMTNLGQVLSAAGLGWAQVAKCTIYLTDMGHFAQVNQVYQEFFDGLEDLPARACFAVAGLPKDALVEIEAIASR
jgi:2-iminobutanoate/2-iminopropanoate deaminase